MKSPIAAQFEVHGGWQRNDAILVSFAMADEELVFASGDVVNGQAQTFAQAQTATIDELERGAIAAQANVGEEVMNLPAGEHGRKGVVIFGADLSKDAPMRFTQQIDEAHFGGGDGLSDGLGAPMLLEFDEEEVVAQLGFGEVGRVAGEMLVDKPELAIVGVASAIGVVMQGQEIGEAIHRLIGVVIIDGIGVIPGGCSNGGGGLRPALAFFGSSVDAVSAVRLLVDVAGE